MNGRTVFRQADLVRALKAASKAGLAVRLFEIHPDGKLVVVTGEPEPATRNYLAEWQASRARQERPSITQLKGWDDVVDGTAAPISAPKPST